MLFDHNSDKSAESEDRQALRNALVSLLARREYARSELEQRFSAKFSEELLSRELDRLIELGYQSDVRYTSMLVRNRLEKRYGLLKIRFELSQKKIDSGLVAQVLEELQPDWFQLAADCWERKFGGQSEPLAIDAKRKHQAKQMRYLLQRGFTSEQARYAMTQLHEE